MEFSEKLQTEETTLLDIMTHRTGAEPKDFLLVGGYPDGMATRKKIAEYVY